MFVGDFQMLRNKRHFVISVMAINVFYCIGNWEWESPFIYSNTQVLRYLLFCEGGIFSAKALTLVGTKLTPYIGITLYPL